MQYASKGLINYSAAYCILTAQWMACALRPRPAAAGCALLEEASLSGADHVLTSGSLILHVCFKQRTGTISNTDCKHADTFI